MATRAATTTTTARATRATRRDASARACDARSRANLVRVTPCVGEIFRCEALGLARGDDATSTTARDDDDARDADARAVRRRTFFATNAIAVAATACATATDAANALEDVPREYARVARALVDALSTSLEHEAANANKPPGERYKFAKPAKEAVKAYISYDGGGASASAASSASRADIAEALRELSAFYKKNGAAAEMPAEVRDRILSRLHEARDLLPAPEPTIADRLRAL